MLAGLTCESFALSRRNRKVISNVRDEPRTVLAGKSDARRSPDESTRASLMLAFAASSPEMLSSAASGDPYFAVA
jgi:hypothetical protein